MNTVAAEEDEEGQNMREARDTLQALQELLAKSVRQVFVALDTCVETDLSLQEEWFLESVRGLCEENEATLRCLVTVDEIWWFVNETVPEMWDPVYGPRRADVAEDAVIYYVRDWGRFAETAVACVKAKHQTAPDDGNRATAEDDDVIETASERGQGPFAYEIQKDIELLFRVIGVDTIVLDFLLPANIHTSGAAAAWRSLVPVQRILGPCVGRFLECLCTFFGLSVSHVRDTAVQRINAIEERTRRCTSFYSVLDYAIDCIWRRQPGLQGIATEVRPGQANQVLTVVAGYCNSFWDTNSLATFTELINLLILVDNIVALSASTAVYLCGDICTALLAILCDGRVAISTPGIPERFRNADHQQRVTSALRRCKPVLNATYVLPPLKRDAEHPQAADTADQAQCGNAQSHGCSVVGQKPDAASDHVLGKRRNSSAEVVDGPMLPSVEERSPLDPSTDNGEACGTQLRAISFMRKLHRFPQLSAVVTKAFSRIVSTG
ncbi:hypothetical protein BESB_010580 [Besnoitia besnoiti]|uniref:Uncharacterized protein n=1 Tax=Besnoitia besnoiti TaxID=94643 RepID=A0A2A9MQB9_BESBE|nr:hypothetical protein BESB_010580 [Besnoitia besnoiti]PFH38716.1 hypothetical protein BESB_010580 [Besnoitia besnoiti]